jgi:hypothetical protein
MAQQSSREFAATDPTKEEEDARIQERGFRATISLSPCSSAQYFNVQRHLTSAKTHRAFRASAWREVAVASNNRRMAFYHAVFSWASEGR